MNTSSLLRRTSLILGTVFQLSILDSQAFNFTLHEQSGLTGFINGGGGGTVVITPIGTDHWTVTVTDPRIGNSTSPTLSLAFIEPELVSGMTAYNNVQVLSVNPGVAVFDVLSDEFSPYSTIVPNNTPAQIGTTDIDPIILRFNDMSDVPEPGIASLLVGTPAILLFAGRRARHAP